MTRYTPEELQQTDIAPPDRLDYLEFDYQSVTFRVYGILHGITGGLNQEYVSLVKDSIRSADGIKLAEKGMKQLYAGCGIDEELEDWLVLRRVDCLTMGFQLIADPRCLWMITIDALREKLQKKDLFVTNNKEDITQLGGSPYFHYMDEYARRELICFLPSEEAISKDLYSMSKWYRSILPKKRHAKIEHPQWHRLLLLERLMHIPCRSIHMLHYALAYAKRHEHKLVNLFVGETHNTDMHYLAEHSQRFSESLGSESRRTMEAIVSAASFFGARSTIIDRLKLAWRKLNYIAFLLLGALLPISFYGGLFYILMR